MEKARAMCVQGLWKRRQETWEDHRPVGTWRQHTIAAIMITFKIPGEGPDGNFNPIFILPAEARL